MNELLDLLFRRLSRRNRLILACAILVTILALALAQYQGWIGTGDESTAPSTFAAGSGQIGVFVEPDDGRAPIVQELDAARSTITLQIYLITDEEIASALERAAARGVEVRVLLEEHPFGGAGGQERMFARLQQAGIDIRWSDPTFTFSHVKTFVVDGTIAIIMNLNLSKSAFTGNREFGTITTREAEVAQAVAIFEADWSRTGAEASGPLVVSPTTSRRAILDLIDGATRTLDIYAEVVRDEEVVNALLDAQARGVTVRLIVSPEAETEDRGREERAELIAAGVQVRYASGLYIHAKMILVDGSRAFVGSQNFTATSLDQNREIGVVLDDPHAIARLSATFEADFARAKVPT